MKLVLQIALGVFLGTFASHAVFDSWQAHRENSARIQNEQKRIDQTNIRQEQGKKIRELLMQKHQTDSSSPGKSVSDFIPDDAQEPAQ